MDLLYFGDSGWGDELAIATLMTIAVSITAMVIGFLFDNFKGVNNAAKIKPISIAVMETAIVINVAIASSSPQPLSPKYKRSIT